MESVSAERAMRDDHFETVTIKTERLGRLANINTREVAKELAEQWPGGPKGAACRKAVKVCLDHLRWTKKAEAVRAAFVDAAKESDIFVREGGQFE